MWCKVELLPKYWVNENSDLQGRIQDFGKVGVGVDNGDFFFHFLIITKCSVTVISKIPMIFKHFLFLNYMLWLEIKSAARFYVM